MEESAPTGPPPAPTNADELALIGQVKQAARESYAAISWLLWLLLLILLLILLARWLDRRWRLARAKRRLANARLENEN